MPLPESGGPQARIVVGRIGAPHGVRGEMRLFPETDFPERLRAGRRVVLCPVSGAAMPTRIVRVRAQGDRGLLLSVQGVITADTARLYAGGTLCVAAEDLPPLPEGHYYHHQLVGLTVLRADGGPVGRLVEVLVTGANDVYAVEALDGRRVLVPAIRDAVAAIDLQAGVMRLADLPGLLED